MTESDAIKAHLSALSALAIAMIESHPDRYALAKRLDAKAEEFDGRMLAYPVSDETIAQSVELIRAFRLFAHIGS